MVELSRAGLNPRNKKSKPFESDSDEEESKSKMEFIDKNMELEMGWVTNKFRL